uniref:Uncharacterized protein n=1 Tax=viral metagenome TaxID=1070528 RepID=A0A6H1ZEM1_9ZZZZ
MSSIEFPNTAEGWARWQERQSAAPGTMVPGYALEQEDVEFQRLRSMEPVGPVTSDRERALRVLAQQQGALSLGSMASAPMEAPHIGLLDDATVARARQQFQALRAQAQKPMKSMDRYGSSPEFPMFGTGEGDVEEYRKRLGITPEPPLAGFQRQVVEEAATEVKGKEVPIIFMPADPRITLRYHGAADRPGFVMVSPLDHPDDIGYMDAHLLEEPLRTSTRGPFGDLAKMAGHPWSVPEEALKLQVGSIRESDIPKYMEQMRNPPKDVAAGAVTAEGGKWSPGKIKTRTVSDTQLRKMLVRQLSDKIPGPDLKTMSVEDLVKAHGEMEGPFGASTSDRMGPEGLSSLREAKPEEVADWSARRKEANLPSGTEGVRFFTYSQLEPSSRRSQMSPFATHEGPAEAGPMLEWAWALAGPKSFIRAYPSMLGAGITGSKGFEAAGWDPEIGAIIGSILGLVASHGMGRIPQGAEAAHLKAWKGTTLPSLHKPSRQLMARVEYELEGMAQSGQAESAATAQRALEMWRSMPAEQQQSVFREIVATGRKFENQPTRWRHFMEQARQGKFLEGAVGKKPTYHTPQNVNLQHAARMIQENLRREEGVRSIRPESVRLAEEGSLRATGEVEGVGRPREPVRESTAPGYTPGTTRTAETGPKPKPLPREPAAVDPLDVAVREWKKQGVPPNFLPDLAKIESSLIQLRETQAKIGAPDVTIVKEIARLEAQQASILETVRASRKTAEEGLAEMTPEVAEEVLASPEGKSREAIEKAGEIVKTRKPTPVVLELAEQYRAGMERAKRGKSIETPPNLSLGKQNAFILGYKTAKGGYPLSKKDEILQARYEKALSWKPSEAPVPEAVPEQQTSPEPAPAAPTTETTEVPVEPESIAEGVPPEKADVEEFTGKKVTIKEAVSPGQLPVIDHIADLKTRFDKKEAWSRFIQERQLSPEMDAKDFYDLYDQVTQKKAASAERTVDFAPNAIYGITGEQIQVTKHDGHFKWVSESGRTGGEPGTTLPPDRYTALDEEAGKWMGATAPSAEPVKADIEIVPKKAEKVSSPKAPEALPGPQEGEAGQPPISKRQLASLQAKRRKAGYSDEEYRVVLKKKFGKKHFRDLTIDEYQTAIDSFPQKPKPTFKEMDAASQTKAILKTEGGQVLINQLRDAKVEALVNAARKTKKAKLPEKRARLEGELGDRLESELGAPRGAEAQTWWNALSGSNKKKVLSRLGNTWDTEKWQARKWDELDRNQRLTAMVGHALYPEVGQEASKAATPAEGPKVPIPSKASPVSAAEPVSPPRKPVPGSRYAPVSAGKTGLADAFARGQEDPKAPSPPYPPPKGWFSKHDHMFQAGQMFERGEKLSKKQQAVAKKYGIPLEKAKPEKPSQEPWELPLNEYLKRRFSADDPSALEMVDDVPRIQRDIYKAVGKRVAEQVGIRPRPDAPLSGQDLKKVQEFYAEKAGVQIEIQKTPVHLQLRGPHAQGYSASGGIVRIQPGVGPSFKGLEQLGVIRHEIEHLIDEAGGYSGKYSGHQIDKTRFATEMLDELDKMGKGHHKDWSNFDVEYLHRRSVEEALKEGKKVPAEVLARYPSLTKKAPPKGSEFPGPAAVTEPAKVAEPVSPPRKPVPGSRYAPVAAGKTGLADAFARGQEDPKAPSPPYPPPKGWFSKHDHMFRAGQDFKNGLRLSAKTKALVKKAGVSIEKPSATVRTTPTQPLERTEPPAPPETKKAAIQAIEDGVVAKLAKAPETLAVAPEASQAPEPAPKPEAPAAKEPAGKTNLLDELAEKREAMRAQASDLAERPSTVVLKDNRGGKELDAIEVEIESLPVGTKTRQDLQAEGLSPQPSIGGSIGITELRRGDEFVPLKIPHPEEKAKVKLVGQGYWSDGRILLKGKLPTDMAAWKEHGGGELTKEMVESVMTGQAAEAQPLAYVSTTEPDRNWVVMRRSDGVLAVFNASYVQRALQAYPQATFKMEKKGFSVFIYDGAERIGRIMAVRALEGARRYFRQLKVETEPREGPPMAPPFPPKPKDPKPKLPQLTAKKYPDVTDAREGEHMLRPGKPLGQENVGLYETMEGLFKTRLAKDPDFKNNPVFDVIQVPPEEHLYVRIARDNLRDAREVENELGRVRNEVASAEEGVAKAIENAQGQGLLVLEWNGGNVIYRPAIPSEVLAGLKPGDRVRLSQLWWEKPAQVAKRTKTKAPALKKGPAFTLFKMDGKSPGRSVTLATGFGGAQDAFEALARKVKIGQIHKVAREAGIDAKTNRTEYEWNLEMATGKRSTKKMTDSELLQAHNFLRSKLQAVRGRRAVGETLTHGRLRETLQLSEEQHNEFLANLEAELRVADMPTAAPMEAMGLAHMAEIMPSPTPVKGKDLLDNFRDPMEVLERTMGEKGVRIARILVDRIQHREKLENEIVSAYRGILKMLPKEHHKELFEWLDGVVSWQGIADANLTPLRRYIKGIGTQIRDIKEPLLDTLNWIRVNRTKKPPIPPMENHISHIVEGLWEGHFQYLDRNNPQKRILNRFLEERKGGKPYSMNLSKVLMIHARAMIRSIVWDEVVEVMLKEWKKDSLIHPDTKKYLADLVEYVSGTPPGESREFASVFPQWSQPILRPALRVWNAGWLTFFLGGSVNSALRNASQITFAFLRTDADDMLYGMASYLARTGQAKEIIKEVAAAGARFGVITEKKVGDFLGVTVEAGGRFTMAPFSLSELWNRGGTVVASYRARYREAINAGLEEAEAKKYAATEAYGDVAFSQFMFNRGGTPRILWSTEAKSFFNLARFPLQAAFMIANASKETLKGLARPEKLKAELKGQIRAEVANLRKSVVMTEAQAEREMELRLARLWPLYRATLRYRGAWNRGIPQGKHAAEAAARFRGLDERIKEVRSEADTVAMGGGAEPPGPGDVGRWEAEAEDSRGWTRRQLEDRSYRMLLRWLSAGAAAYLFMEIVKVFSGAIGYVYDEAMDYLWPEEEVPEKFKDDPQIVAGYKKQRKEWKEKNLRERGMDMGGTFGIEQFIPGATGATVDAVGQMIRKIQDSGDWWVNFKDGSAWPLTVQRLRNVMIAQEHGQYESRSGYAELDPETGEIRRPVSRWEDFVRAMGGQVHGVPERRRKQREKTKDVRHFMYDRADLMVPIYWAVKTGGEKEFANAVQRIMDTKRFGSKEVEAWQDLAAALIGFDRSSEDWKLTGPKAFQDREILVPMTRKDAEIAALELSLHWAVENFDGKKIREYVRELRERGVIHPLKDKFGEARRAQRRKREKAEARSERDEAIRGVREGK